MKKRQKNGKQPLLFKYPKPLSKLKPNVIYCADNLQVMKQLPSESIDLIYGDPPFNTGSVRRSKAWDKEVQIGDFDDKWGGGINSYVLWLERRLREMHRLLKPTGVLCVHLDYNAVHYIKVCLDKIFGYDNPDKGRKHLVNELIWCYKSGGASKKSFAKKHDTILVYSKTKKYTFNQTKIKSYGQAGGGQGGAVKYFKDKNGTYSVVNARDWIECSMLSTTHPERLPYPTQKPIALLDQFIKAFSNKDDLVADFFCGCGTTISSAHGLGRRWIGCDVSKKAAKTIRKRMARDHKLDIKPLPLKSLTKAQILKLNPREFEKYAVRSIGGTPTPNSKPIDGQMPDGSPIEVKMHDKPIGVGVLNAFHKFLQKNGRGYIVSKAFGRGFKDEVARLKNEEGLDVVFITIDDIIRDAA